MDDEDSGLILSNGTKSISCFQVDNGWIYFLNANDPNIIIQRTLLNDHAQTELFDLGKNANSWVVNQDFIYYVENSEDGNDIIFVYNILDQSVTSLNSESFNVERIEQIYDKYLYVISNDYIVYMIDTETGYTHILDIDLEYNSLVMVRGDYLVYSLPQSNKLVILKVKGQNKKALTTDLDYIQSGLCGTYFTMDEDGVYWQNNAGKVYRLSYDTYKTEYLYTADCTVLFEYQLNAYTSFAKGCDYTYYKTEESIGIPLDPSSIYEPLIS